ncbi:MAG TPA: KH domain-containing protein [Candidatus Atribacteria bacterium]|nr:KH domain-containing protein [Candidatus Atribacteria bacterium]
MLRELIELIIKGIVDNPDKVEINEIIGEKSSIFEVRVDPSDIGKVIGRQGRNIKSVRTIVNAAAQKEDKRAVIEIID